MTGRAEIVGRGSRTPPGHQAKKGDDYTTFKGEERTEPAAITGYAIHLTQVGKDWWGWVAFKGRTPIGKETHYAYDYIAVHEANAFIAKHAEEDDHATRR